MIFLISVWKEVIGFGFICIGEGVPRLAFGWHSFALV